LFLQNYGLGTPFIEDVKLCAALGSFWPAVAPDATRTFQPIKEPQGSSWPWPTIVPLTDEEIGIAEVKGGGFVPWDGVRGPQIVRPGLIQYPNINQIDYVSLGGKLTAQLTSRIDFREYQTRVIAMSSVYKVIGLKEGDFLSRYHSKEDAMNRLQLAKSRWAVVSFRKLDEATPELQTAQRETQTTLELSNLYRFYLCRYCKQEVDQSDRRKVLVETQDPMIFYVDRTTVLVQYEGGKWWREKTISM
jgi:hypothetical protein